MVGLTSRRFSGGSWDLRKDERRKAQQPITFPDRRSGERRSFGFPDFESDSSNSYHHSGSEHSIRAEKR